jgi:hypothetical protein
MRNAMVQLSAQRRPNEQRQVLRAAIRQLERADIYLAAVAYMDLDDDVADRSIRHLRAELDGLRHHLSAERIRIRD